MRTEQRTDRPGEVAPPPDGGASSRGPARPDRRGVGGWIFAGLAIVLAAGLIAFAVDDLAPGGSSAASSVTTSAAIARSLTQSHHAPLPSPASRMIASVLPSVVNVRVVQVAPRPRRVRSARSGQREPA
jgi:S1-C subfamily serine protease